MDTREKAELLRSYHLGPPVLVLPNAWDVASAVLIARVPGCRALATTSAGVAWGRGYADGERIPREEMLEVVRRIAVAVELPVTADLEAGYGRAPEAAAETAALALEAGAAGLNLEDGTDETPLLEVEEQVERIAAVVAAGERAGIPLVLNARTDVFLAGEGSPEEQTVAAVERLNAYLAAGADCAFPIGVRDAKAIRRLVRDVRGPVGVLARPGMPPVAELAALGVARVSVGGGTARAAYALAAAAAAELLTEGTYDLLREAAPLGDVNALLRA